MSETLRTSTPTPDKRKKGRRRKFGSVRIILILLLTVFIILGYMMMITPYKDYATHKTEISQELTTFREKVAVYKESSTTPPVSPDLPHPSMPTDPTEPGEPGGSTQPEESTPTEEQTPAYLEDLWQSMLDYNQNLVETGQSKLVDAWSVKSTVLDLSEFGLSEGSCGIVTIPDINIEMPLYLGATNTNLSKGFAQLSQTSMPTGGISTNCVIAGHRGYYGMPYMRDVEMLEIGDPIYLLNYWEVLEYHISEILYIDPYQTEVLKIQPGKDLLTIVTCHPYGVGSHRIVLRCERYIPPLPDTPNEPDAPESPDQPDPPKQQDHIPVPVLPNTSQGTWVWEWKETVTITSNQVGTFESSQATIFLVEFLPWICLLIATVILILTLLYTILSAVIRRIKRSKAKKRAATES